MKEEELERASSHVVSPWRVCLSVSRSLTYDYDDGDVSGDNSCPLSLGVAEKGLPNKMSD
jgi:hypothetical protein